ncbi:hypothetical protein ENSA5_12990 [Enhygromyxa salina]|uniref:Uncharacterized protein n=1 Tax=Enhygromyxa salina TaxID=215803 RepID=A0A2S9YF93_9BACT|nr:hypothetical protein [Enhygromyxa salina]PRQ03749.1 hypothetical protein ENSA5_12990 [Enhygromyxa salina]
MEISEDRLELCRVFLDDCYAEHDDRSDFRGHENTVQTYTHPVNQATYSVMYFAKSVATWWAIRDLVEPVGTPSSTRVVSVGAGPQFCLMGWFFDQPPIPESKLWALDALDWSWVRKLSSHARLLEDIIGPTELKTYSGYHFPADAPPQCSARRTRPVEARSFPEGSTVLLPMVMNHIVGLIDPVADTSSLARWFEDLQARVERVVLVDMKHEHSTKDFWQVVSSVLGLAGRPPVISFQDYGGSFAPCYRDRLLPEGRGVQERRRRTGLRWNSFTQVTACWFEADSGWRWLSR